METREEIDEAIEAQKEIIDEDRYQLRWYRRGFLIFWLGISLCASSLLIVAIFGNSVVNSIFGTISGISSIVAVITGGVSGALYLSYLDSYKSKNGPTYEKLRKEKRTLKKLIQRLSYVDELSLRHLTAEQYKHQLPVLIKSYRKRRPLSALVHRNLYYHYSLFSSYYQPFRWLG